MKKAVLHDIKTMQIEEQDIPVIKSNELLIKVMACGVCGTDVHIFEGDKGAAENPLPIVLGHEFSGVVEEIGKDVRGIKPGDRVSVDPNVLCGHCRYCLSGIGHFCENMTGIGTTVNGGFAQYCAVPFQQAYHLADHTTFAQGAMAEPLACCLHGIDMCEIRPGDSVAVIGGGMIGLLMLQLARLCGAAFVALIEPVDEKRRAGQMLGADLCIDPMNEDVLDVLESAGIASLNTVIECAGRPETINNAIEIAGKKSVVMMFGLTKPEETVAIKPYEIFKKEVVLKASFINPYTIGRALELINHGRIDVSSMVAEILPLEELPDVLASAELRKKGKYIIEPWK